MTDRPASLQDRRRAAVAARRTTSPRCRCARLRRPQFLAAALLASLLAVATASAQESAGADRIYLVSSRPLGCRCECGEMSAGLHCEACVVGPHGLAGWQPLSWNDLAAELAAPLPTILYVHGNRVECGEDKAHGLAFYRSLAPQAPAGPVRYVIWSWPSAKIPGVVKDYQEKAARTKAVGWQLAWAVDRMPPETPVTLVGYSYGARVVTGALHLLAGGRLGELELSERIHPVRPPIRAALVAAAVDADWIRPGGAHGRALEQVDHLVIIKNQHDPAMRFYHMAFPGDHRPLGYQGASGLGPLADRVRTVDVTSAVGRHHALSEYLAASGPVGAALAAAVHHPPADPPPVSLAGRSN